MVSTFQASFLSNVKTLFIVLVCSLFVFAHCGKKPGHDKTPYVMKKKLGLNSEQAEEVKRIIEEKKEQRKKDREKYAGDNESLLKAARARDALEKERIEAILDEKQKIRFRDLMAEKEVTDQTLIISERLGLDRTTTNRINKIAVNLPTEQEVIAARNSGEQEALSALKEKTDNLYAEIEYFLNDYQKKIFRQMIQEKLD